MVETCSTVKYQDHWGFRREPARPPHLRIDYCGGMRFDDNFDWDNAWYDAIQVHDNLIVLIGPPLYDAKNWINTNVSFFDPYGKRLPVQFMEIDRVCYTGLTVGAQLQSITMFSNNSAIVIPVRPRSDSFVGRKTMVTMQKNNPIEWVQQWILYHVKVHDVGGFLIYDNGSTDYTAKHLEDMLQGTKAIVKVVEWPYPYGPQGSDYAPWDSDYGQYVMLEHAKLRFLASASMVLNNDVDEYIVTKGISLDDIQQHLMSSSTGCLRYKGIWIEPYDIAEKKSAISVPFAERDIHNYYCTDSNNTIGIGYKWMLVPQKHMNDQWLVHHINSQMIETDQLYYAHHLALNTNWSWQRDEYRGDPANLVPEPYLLSSLAKMDRTP